MTTKILQRIETVLGLEQAAVTAIPEQLPLARGWLAKSLLQLYLLGFPYRGTVFQ